METKRLLLVGGGGGGGGEENSITQYKLKSDCLRQANVTGFVLISNISFYLMIEVYFLTFVFG